MNQCNNSSLQQKPPIFDSAYHVPKNIEIVLGHSELAKCVDVLQAHTKSNPRANVIKF